MQKLECPGCLARDGETHNEFCESMKVPVTEYTIRNDPSKYVKNPACAMPEPVPVPATKSGLKFDGGKPRTELLILGCPRALEGVADVLTFGANKYAAHSWREVEDGINRYIAANHRHWLEIGKHGLASRDVESGKLHIDHINTNGLFISELIRKEYGIE